MPQHGVIILDVDGKTEIANRPAACGQAPYSQGIGTPDDRCNPAERFGSVR